MSFAVPVVRPGFRGPLAVIAAGALVCACSSGDDDLALRTSWLGPLSSYERIAGKDDTGVFILKTGHPAPAERILLEPAEITVSNRSDLNSISPRTYERIRRAFADAIARELSKQAGTRKADAGTYYVRVALTNLTAKRLGQDDGPTGLQDLSFSFDTASLEAEMRDGATNARNAVVLVKAESPTIRAVGLEQTFEKFAVQIAERISAARAALDARSRQAAPAEAPAEKPAAK